MIAYNVQKKRNYILLVSVAFLVFTIVAYGGISSRAIVCGAYSSEMSFINDNSVRPTFWIVPDYWTLLSRQQLSDNLWRINPPGVDQNFIWYAPDVTIRVADYYYTQWSYKGSSGTQWIQLGYYPPPGLFYNYVDLHVLLHNGTFVSRACGNRTPQIYNPGPPKISGYKFNDYDGDGNWDAGEPPIAGWEIGLYRNGNYITSHYTNSYGYYEFSIDANAGLTPGWYGLREAHPDGWQQTKAPGDVWIQEGVPDVNYSGNDFGNFEPGSISGFKFDDSNYSTTWDDSERGLEKWEILLEGILDNGEIFLERRTETAADGSFSFKDLKPGTYYLHEILRDGWENTISPLLPIHLQPGQELTNQNFGNIKLSVICGKKFDDSSGNGIFDPESSEIPVPRWNTIALEGTDVRGQPVYREMPTDENGNYCFSDLITGNYSISEDPTSQAPIVDPNNIGNYTDPGWFKTTLTEEFHLNEGQNIDDINVGNLWYGWIWGRVTDEITKQPLSIPVTISLLEPDETTTTTTDSNGYYFFPKLYPNETTQFPGSEYTVEMTVPPNYKTHDNVTKYAKVIEKQGTRVDFNVYREDWSDGKVPRTIGFWKNWDNHYTRSEMEMFILWVKQASGLFDDLTVDNISTDYLKITKNSTMKQKAEAQLLASWLNVVSSKLGVDVVVDISSISGWQWIITSASPEGNITVLDLLTEVDTYVQKVNDGIISLSKDAWEIIKNILDALNNGQLF